MPLRISTEDLISGTRNVQQWGQNASPSQNIWDIINSESVVTRNMKIEDQINKLRDKHDVRLNMAKWKVTSWNKNADKLENARSSLADYARSQYIEEAKKDKSMDLAILDDMQDQDIIDRMTKDDQNAQKEYINFINNWGFVKDAYNKIMGIDEEALKAQEREESWWFKNFFWAWLSEIPSQVWWLMDITWLSDYLWDIDRERYEKYLTANTDTYNKWKRWEISDSELRDTWISWIYHDYEKDVAEWKYRWSIENYWKAMYDKYMAESERPMNKRLWEDIFNYNPEWAWADAGKFIPQMVEFATLPWAKWKFLWNTVLWTAEILWLNALSEWKLPTVWEAWVTAGMTAALEWILRLPWWYKWLRGIVWKVSPELKEALWNTTRETWKKWSWVVNKWLTATKKEATNILNKAATWIKSKMKTAWENLWAIRKSMKWDFKYQDFFDSINEEFKKFETEWWWGKNAAPEIKIDKAGNMEIHNEDALSNVTDANWIKLLDYIKSEWNAFRNQGRADNIQNAERFMEDLNAKIYEAIEKKGINRNDSAVKSLLNAVKNWYEKLYSRMWQAWQDFKKAREDFSNMDTYAKFFEKYIWKLKEGKKWADALNELEKEMSLWEKWFGKWWDYIGEFLKILKNNNIVDEDLSSQLMSLVYSFWIKNPKLLQELIDTVYPSIPWVREIWLEFWRKWMKSAEAESMLMDAPIQQSDIWAAISKAVRPAAQVKEERLLEY